MKIIQPKAVMMYSFPRNYHRDMMDRADMLDEKGRLSERYCELQAKYKKLVCDWLMSKVDFVAIENSYFDNGWLGMPVDDEKKTIYQYFCDLNTNYLYLRNNYYIEKLSDDELTVLCDYVNAPDNRMCYTQALQMVQETFARVIAENDNSNTKELFKETLDEVIFCPSNALVFAARATIKTGLTDADSMAALDKQMAAIRVELQEELRSKIGTFINLPVMMFFE
ncbi:MAG: hypothetical protein Q4D54_02940 [Eubacteriales bacterium]|nr:hypothetical protein [Lachnospiraceae bacterium]MDO5126688.1 hypothetical protein [Eubacteriales bacterium]